MLTTTLSDSSRRAIGDNAFNMAAVLSAKAEAERDVISEIIRGVLSTVNLDELLHLIHRSIGRILYADNCYVALYDAQTELLSMEFFVDKHDTTPLPGQLGRGLTAYVFRTKRPTLLTSEMIDRLADQGEIELKGTAPAQWLGVPLKTRTGIIGVLVVQHYDRSDMYDLRDLELVTAVGDQIALAIERKRAEEALRISEERHRLLFEANPHPAFVCDLNNFSFLAVNEAAVRKYGYSRNEFLKDITLIDIRPPEDVPIFLERVSKVSLGIEMIMVPSRHRTKEGLILDVEITSHSFTFDGRAAELIIVSDVTERKAAEDEAKRLSAVIESQRLHQQAVLDNVPCVIWEAPLDPNAANDGVQPFVNGYVTNMYGYTPEEWLSTPDFWSGILHPDDSNKAFRGHAELFEKGELTSQSRWITKDGRVIWGETRVLVFYDGSGTPVGLRGVTTDITERKALEDQLTHQALHDPLTLLPNRVLFRDRVKHAIDRSSRKRAPVAVLFIDLDNFKPINDTLGHAAGDELLIAVTERLKACLRSSDTPARLGGDEFAVLVEDTEHTEGAVLVAERIRAVLSEPYKIRGTEVFVGTSIGIATSTSPDESPEELLRNADVAMYQSKTDGKNRYTLFESKMHDTLIKRVQIEADMRIAIQQKQFELYYQPIMDLETSRAIGMEALVRWNHPELGQVSPADFIPVAEETGLIVPIGKWILEEACRQAREWQAGFDDGDQFSITVNISSRQFTDGDLFETVKTALADSQLPPDCLVLEITETTMLANTETTILILQKLKSLGIRLAIDDFGTGYSSLNYLQRFPMDILKIDKSFIDNIANGREGSAVARAIITMSETLNLKTIAEGIESLVQSSELQSLGCELGQGYHFARPLPAEEMGKFLSVSSSFGNIKLQPPAQARIWDRINN